VKHMFQPNRLTTWLNTLRGRPSEAVLTAAEQRVWERIRQAQANQPTSMYASLSLFRPPHLIGFAGLALIAVCAVVLEPVVAHLLHSTTSTPPVASNSYRISLGGAKNAVSFTIDQSTLQNQSTGSFGYLRQNNPVGKDSGFTAHAAEAGYQPVTFFSLDSKIFSYNLSTNTRTQVGPREVKLSNPEFSTQNQYLAANLEANGTAQAVVINPLTNAVVYTTDSTDPLITSWSPDGSKLLTIGSGSAGATAQIVEAFTWKVTRIDLSQFKLNQPSLSDPTIQWIGPNTIRISHSTLKPGVDITPRSVDDAPWYSRAGTTPDDYFRGTSYLYNVVTKEISQEDTSLAGLACLTQLTTEGMAYYLSEEEQALVRCDPISRETTVVPGTDKADNVIYSIVSNKIDQMLVERRSKSQEGYYTGTSVYTLIDNSGKEIAYQTYTANGISTLLGSSGIGLALNYEVDGQTATLVNFLSGETTRLY
jgi:hypothetical protein